MKLFTVPGMIVILCATSALAQTNYSGSNFNCPSLSSGNGPPSNVHRLRPSDIQVIGGMGNSLTAGFAILSNLTTIQSMPTDYRGLAWSAGGDSSLPYVTTLPNLLRQYTSNLYGYSEGTTPFPLANFTDLPNTRLNVGRTGAVARDMLEQAKTLVNKTMASDEVNFEEDWKMITLLIGSNDLCRTCNPNYTQGDPDEWILDITNALDYLQTNLPRTFVSVVQLTNISASIDTILSNMAMQGICMSFLSRICPCQFTNEEEFIILNRQYQEKLDTLVASGRYDTTDDFTVVLQPLQSKLIFREIDGEPDLSNMAVDCTHLSATGNRNIALGLWNNLFERVGEKNEVLTDPIGEIICPTDDNPYFYTSKNSLSGSQRIISLNFATVLGLAAALQLLLILM